MGCNSILALSVFLGSVLTHFEACSFHPKILQNIYCDSDFVMRVKIDSQYTIDGVNAKYRFGISHRKTFRFSSDSGYLHANKTFLWAGAKELLYGVDLIVGKTYIVTGHVTDSTLRVGLCDWLEEWKKLTSYQQKAVRNTWRNQCGKCKVKLCSDCKSCHGIGCGHYSLLPPPPQDTCMLNMSDEGAQCYQEYSVCRMSYGVCSFVKNNNLDECLE